MKNIKNVGLLITGFLLGAFVSIGYEQTAMVITQVGSTSHINLVAGDTIKCGIDTTSFAVAYSTESLINYTVPSGEVLQGALSLSAMQQP